MLAVSRTTVVTAYDLLRQDGLVESRRGSGTRVSGGLEMTPGIASDEAGDLLGGAMAAKESMTLFTQAALGGAKVVAETIAGLDPNEIARQEAESGYEALGIPELRRAVADHLAAEGVPTSPDEVLITNGGQQAISLLAQMYLRPGDRVVVEDPTFIGAIDAFRAIGARMIPVPVGHDGADVESLREALGRTPPALVYLVPTFQAPTGTVMPEAAGRAVARLAKETGVPVIGWWPKSGWMTTRCRRLWRRTTRMSQLLPWARGASCSGAGCGWVGFGRQRR